MFRNEDNFLRTYTGFMGRSRIVLGAALLCLLLACAPILASAPRVMPLDGEWRLRAEPAEIDWHTRFWEGLSQQECLDAGFDDSKWATARVPGYVQFDCDLKSRYWGYELFRVNFSPWVYRKTFSVPAEFRGRQVMLKFGGVQYWTTVWLNGRKLGRHEGYFDPFSFDVGGRLNYTGENVLVVSVTNPWSWEQPGTGKNTVQGLLENWDAKPMDLLPLGIWQPVKLIEHSGLIDRAQVDVDLKPDHSSAKVTLKGWMLHRGNADRMRFEVLPIGFKPRAPLPRPIEVPLSRSGEGSASASVTINLPELWWTWDQGKPNLYMLRVTALAVSTPVHTQEIRFGVRSVRMDMKMESGAFYLNGRKVFLRGSLRVMQLTQAPMIYDLAITGQKYTLMILGGCHLTRYTMTIMAAQLRRLLRI